jgi:hypothetical protein
MMLFMDDPSVSLYRVTLALMDLCDVFLGLGEGNFQGLLKSVSMGKLKTYQLFERFKTRAHLQKLNADTLRRAAPRLWVRMGERNGELATDMSQAVLISHLDMIVAVLNYLGVPHEDGFFAKDAEVSKYLTEGWQQNAWNQFRDQFPPAALLFYLNHLAWETGQASEVYTPPS